MESLEILKKYWGYPEFRNLQPEIISSILSGTDSLALLPTGGGKSICFQVPGIQKEGIVLVISPLIALIKDQIDQLRKRKIPCLAIYSGMSYREIDQLLDNACYGKYKFLYISPERIQTPLFQERFKKMNVSFIAVDEAHCISQWGYDFRPSYLQIALLREIQPNLSILALTASATKEVVQDIQEKLLFKNGQVFQKSFERKNLLYEVHHEVDKRSALLTLLGKEKGSAIVYASTRRATQETASFLSSKGISATSFHAGIPAKEKDSRQNAWISNQIRVIVATNAFGMGIDKPDVRLVVHLNMPSNLEAYFQEAGRAGRDLKPAKSIVLNSTNDKSLLLKKLDQSWPEKQFIKSVYNLLGNHFRLAYGSGLGETFSFELAVFCEKYHLSIIETYNSLKILEQLELIHLSDGVFSPSKIQFKINSNQLYHFQVAQKRYSGLLQFLLRSKASLFDQLTKVSEVKIAKQLNSDSKRIEELFHQLHQLEVIEYIPKGDTPKIFFAQERLNETSLRIPKEKYEDRKATASNKLESVLEFLESSTCKSQLLLNYFGQNSSPKCGRCNLCTKDMETPITKSQENEIKKQLLELFSHQKKLDNVVSSLPFDDKIILEIIRELLDSGDLIQSSPHYFQRKLHS